MRDAVLPDDLVCCSCIEETPMGASRSSSPMGASRCSSPMGASRCSSPMGASRSSSPMGASRSSPETSEDEDITLGEMLARADAARVAPVANAVLPSASLPASPAYAPAYVAAPTSA